MGPEKGGTGSYLCNGTREKAEKGGINEELLFHLPGLSVFAKKPRRPSIGIYFA